MYTCVTTYQLPLLSLFLALSQSHVYSDCSHKAMFIVTLLSVFSPVIKPSFLARVLRSRLDQWEGKFHPDGIKQQVPSQCHPQPSRATISSPGEMLCKTVLCGSVFVCVCVCMWILYYHVAKLADIKTRCLLYTSTRTGLFTLMCIWISIASSPVPLFWHTGNKRAERLPAREKRGTGTRLVSPLLIIIRIKIQFENHKLVVIEVPAVYTDCSRQIPL